MKKAFILGSSHCMMGDLATARMRCRGEADVWAVKFAGVKYPGELKGWASLHVEKFAPLLGQRRENKYPDPEFCVVHRARKPDEKWPLLSGVTVVVQPEFLWGEGSNSGSSSLYAVKTCIQLGYERIVLCGCPMDADSEHMEPNGKARFAKAAESFKRGWTSAFPEINGKVKSMSGWTRALLGEPEEGWFESSNL